MLRINRAVRAGVCVLALAFAATATACGGGREDNLLGNVEDDKLTIGIRFDQPGLGLRTTDGTYTGFDVDVAYYVADKLGVKPENITFKEALPAERETLIENGQVDLVVATYSITDKRKEKVDFAGPYYIVGQDLLVRADNTDITDPSSLPGKKVCSVKGSTPAQNIEKKYPQARLQTYDSYSMCIEALRRGAIDAVTTDKVILAGYAAQTPGVFKLVNKTFTIEKYGIGLRKGDTELRGKVNDAIDAMIDGGLWKALQEKNFAGTGFSVPIAPAVERY